MPDRSRRAPRGIVVVGISLGDGSSRVARVGLEVGRALESRTELVHAFTPMRYLLRLGGSPSDLDSWSRTHGDLKRRLQRLAAELDVGDADVGWHVEDGRPFEVLNDVASSLDADLIVVGALERDTLASGALGSTADRLLRTSIRPLLIARGERPTPPRRVLAAIDLSTLSAEAYRGGQLLLDQMGAGDVELAVLMVLDPKEVQEPLESEQLETFVAGELEHVVAHFGKRDPVGVSFRVRRGRPQEQILRELQEGEFDLVIVGTHGRSGGQRLLLGSVTSDLVRRSPCNVLVLPPAAARLASLTLDAPAVEPLAHRARGDLANRKSGA